MDGARYSSHVLGVPRVALVVGDPNALTPAERRLIGQLTGDPRFDLVGIARRLHEAGKLNPVTQTWIGVEERVISPPQRQALPEIDLRDFAVVDEQNAEKLAPVDVVIDMHSTRPCETSRDIARHGYWFFETRDQQAASASLHGHPTTEIALCAIGTSENVDTLDWAVFDAKTLVSHNIRYAQEKSVQLVIAALARLAVTADPRSVAPLAPDNEADAGSALAYPSHVLKDVVGRVHERVSEKRGRAVQPFTLRIGHGDYVSFDPAHLQDIKMPAGAYWADPFLIEHEGELYCFFEDLPVTRGLAHISVGRVDGDALVDVQDALRLPVHMSYPFVFHHGTEVYMMPEVHSAGRLEIWRATRFPTEWELSATAFEGTPVCDSTLFHDGETWWLFTHISHDSFGDFCNELHLFQCSGPDLKSITPHPLNPIVVGADTARGGGRIKRIENRLIRPSQDNSGGSYGWALNLMEITRLSATEYEERRFRHITPAIDDRLIGCHHADFAAGRIIVDVRWR